MVGFQQVQHAIGGSKIGDTASLPVAQCPALDGHGIVDHVGWHGDVLWRDAPGVRIGREKRSPVIPLVKDRVGQFQQPGLACQIVNRLNSQHQFWPTHAAPIKERCARQLLGKAAIASQQRRDDTGVAGSAVILEGGLDKDRYRPRVERAIATRGRILPGPQPTIRTLVCENGIDPAGHPGDEPLVLQQKGQGNRPIQPVWASLPSLRGASDPAACRHIGPEFVQVPAQAIGLDAQLLEQPTSRAYLAQAQRPEHRRDQTGLLCNHHRPPAADYSPGQALWPSPERLPHWQPAATMPLRELYVVTGRSRWLYLRIAKSLCGSWTRSWRG